MKSYRCIVRSAGFMRSEKTLKITAPDCRAAADAALRQARAPETSAVEVWDADELVLVRRQSNLHPLQAANRMARAALAGGGQHGKTSDRNKGPTREPRQAQLNRGAMRCLIDAQPSSH
ncbi:MAG: hypothetical protein AB7E79_15490 [Rhodospirillaceae bacterium]